MAAAWATALETIRPSFVCLILPAAACHLQCTVPADPQPGTVLASKQQAQVIQHHRLHTFSVKLPPMAGCHGVSIGPYYYLRGLRSPLILGPNSVHLSYLTSMTNNGLTRECLERLRRFDACTLSNAIESTQIRPPNEGYIVGTALCRFPKLPPVIGYAVTGRARSSMPSGGGGWCYQQLEWWHYLVSVPAPRIVVVQDGDRPPGRGAVFGEVHARVCRALDCVAYVTNGAVGDLPGVEALGFQLFAGGVTPSHGYADVVEFGEPIELGGLRIDSGDLLHGDLHGVQTVPIEVAEDLPTIAERILLQEEELYQLCSDRNFSVDVLAAGLERDKVERASWG